MRRGIPQPSRRLAVGTLSLGSLDPSILPRTELCSVTLAFGNAVVHSGFNFHNAHSEPLEVILYLRCTQRLRQLMPTTKDRRKAAVGAYLQFSN